MNTKMIQPVQIAGKQSTFGLERSYVLSALANPVSKWFHVHVWIIFHTYKHKYTQIRFLVSEMEHVLQCAAYISNILMCTCCVCTTCMCMNMMLFLLVQMHAHKHYAYVTHACFVRMHIYLICPGCSNLHVYHTYVSRIFYACVQKYMHVCTFCEDVVCYMYMSYVYKLVYMDVFTQEKKCVWTYAKMLCTCMSGRTSKKQSLSLACTWIVYMT
jgi:hypothetical protein